MRTTPSILLAAALFLAGCASNRVEFDPESPFEHRVPVPDEFAWGKGSPHFDSALDRYVSNFEAFYWHVLSLYAGDIDTELTLGDRAGVGGPASCRGAWDGAAAAEARVRELRDRLGREWTVEALSSVFADPGF